MASLSKAHSSSSKSPTVNISPQCHLDPASYVKGNHLLTLESAVLVHPRSKLFTDAGPITIREGSIISEKCTIGSLSGSGQLPAHQNEQNSALPKPSSTSGQDTQQDHVHQREHAITIGKSVYIHPNVTILPPSTIADFAILESGVTIQSGCTIGAHSKICAGVNLPSRTAVPIWTVVYGIDGRTRRGRHRDVTEDFRLDGMSRERITATHLLRANASINKLASSTSASTSRDKRQSVLAGDGGKPA